MNAHHPNPLRGVAVVLAPLAGITDAIYRRICLDFGADMVFSEMISADGLVRAHRRLRALRDMDVGEGATALQIFGSDPATMRDAAAILSQYGPRLIDINFGCPVKKIVKKNGGAALLKDLDLLGRVAEAVVAGSTRPVSAKVRTGWDEASPEGVRDIGRTLEGAGISVVTVHARSKAQAFRGRADWSQIAMMKETVSIPVIGNGDVWSADDYIAMRNETGCDAVMIGRGAIGNPWIFDEIQSRIRGARYAAPEWRVRLGTMLDHVRQVAARIGEPTGVITSRKIMAAYVKHLPNARELRGKLMQCERVAEVETVLEPLGVAETRAQQQTRECTGG